MLTSPANIREQGRQAAVKIQEAAEALRGALAQSQIPPGRGRTGALLRAAEGHAEVVRKLDGAIELMRELY
jgi:hypothetical protein